MVNDRKHQHDRGNMVDQTHVLDAAQSFHNLERDGPFRVSLDQASHPKGEESSHFGPVFNTI